MSAYDCEKCGAGPGFCECDKVDVEALSRLAWGDQSTAHPVEKARRVLGRLIEPDDVYFFNDGFPRSNVIAEQAKNVLEVLNAYADRVIPPAQDVYDLGDGMTLEYRDFPYGGEKAWGYCKDGVIYRWVTDVAERALVRAMVGR